MNQSVAAGINKWCKLKHNKDDDNDLNNGHSGEMDVKSKAK